MFLRQNFLLAVYFLVIVVPINGNPALVLKTLGATLALQSAPYALTSLAQFNKSNKTKSLLALPASELAVGYAVFKYGSQNFICTSSNKKLTRLVGFSLLAQGLIFMAVGYQQRKDFLRENQPSMAALLNLGNHITGISDLGLINPRQK